MVEITVHLITIGHCRNWIFPSFNGDNPQFWRTKCEKYFAVYGLQPDLWVRVATLHFTGNTARWLQVHEKKGTVWGCDRLYSMLFEKFGREHYQNLLRQFNNLKQQGTVLEYMSQFEDLMHQILAHNPAIDTLFFTTQFLEGLKSDIKAGVILHRHFASSQRAGYCFFFGNYAGGAIGGEPRQDYRHCGDPAYHCMCSMQVVDITLMKHRLTSITSIRVVQQKHRRSTVCL
jgi:hypothetical protein